MDITQVIIKPLLTEKSTLLKDRDNKVTFLVHPKANKYQIKSAVEELFGVRVERVNVVRKRPRALKRFGRVVGKKAGSKKAYVTLAPGDKIEFFEGV
ncbi:large subunit ribosomal protein L23 [Desulfonauticus submarinus]|uniref:Large ribosomal subunit protein uL23 n=1 Tax=Desulfonauticus submarinus TaxID=206665 RepID=A0A1H0G5T9_9BACT|nr:50S ribosomal protein L23 [Desulfonauticus submarinus]SDO02211.1 large subunit ribosomal protein L23 [Desulfonauticus submarinus]